MSIKIEKLVNTLLKLSDDDDLEDVRRTQLKVLGDKDFLSLIIWIVKKAFALQNLEVAVLKTFDELKRDRGIHKQRKGVSDLLLKPRVEDGEFDDSSTSVEERPQPRNPPSGSGEVSLPVQNLVLLYPCTDYGKWKWLDFADLKESLNILMIESFRKEFLSLEARVAEFNTVLRNLRNNRNDGACLNQRVIQRTGSSYIYIHAKHNVERSCDSCAMVKTRRLCIRAGDVRGTRKLAITPLPRQLRNGKTGDDIGFWINEAT
ncbi:hypothetical protein T440DRAFT_516666 [Plenodomus tracheiphilus IPT5]|uniref:Uncharacterized protein n=1 Tax=Plenodomus tracheiphilus IPT5 TaxID=1408161 RepID=A0A6A7BDL7_9PLEO|nr:hypothetical protein T440DRAFT_516666 [Plenodomus tracheiphilus IPT5]